MKKKTKFILLLVLLIGTLLMLTACEEPPTPLPKLETAEMERVGKVKLSGVHYNLVQDRDTGCVYIKGDTSFSPYYETSGKVKGCKGNGLMNQP